MEENELKEGEMERKSKVISNKGLMVLVLVLIGVITSSFFVLTQIKGEPRDYTVQEKIVSGGVLTGMTETNAIINGEKVTITKIQLDNKNFQQELEIHNHSAFYEYREAFNSTETTEMVVKVVTEKREFFDGRIEYANILQ